MAVTSDSHTGTAPPSAAHRRCLPPECRLPPDRPMAERAAPCRSTASCRCSRSTAGSSPWREDARGPAARAAALPVHRQQQPGRILRDPRRRHARAAPRLKAPPARRDAARARDACRRDQPGRAGAVSPTSIARSMNEVLPAMAAGPAYACCGMPSATPPSAPGSRITSGARSKPLLTPIGLDPAHPFPQVVNKSLNFIVELSGSGAFGRETAIAIVKAPRAAAARDRSCPSEVAPSQHASCCWPRSSTRTWANCSPDGDVVGYSPVPRDARRRSVDRRGEVKNLRQALEGELPQRQFGLAVRAGGRCAAARHRSLNCCCSNSSSRRPTSIAATARSTLAPG